MKKLLVLIIAGFALAGCQKDEAAEVESSTAVSGKIVCEIDGKAYAHAGSGYVFENNYSFVKAENGSQQLSIDFYGMREGDYIVANAPKTVGNAKITYYPDQATKITYVSKSGTFKITQYPAKALFKVSGTFSAIMEKFNNNVSTGETIEIKNGSFKDLVLIDSR